MRVSKTLRRGFESLCPCQIGGAMYKASKMVLLTGRDGTVQYAKPRHIPMTGWGDYDIVPTEEVEQDEDPAAVAARHARTMAAITKQVDRDELQEEIDSWTTDVLARGVKAGSTVHEVGCPCGFCKAGFTKV